MDARYEHVREDSRVQPMAVMVAYGTRNDGVREVIGLDVTAGEDLEHRPSFLKSLAARGLRDVKPVVSDTHRGLRQATAEVFAGASWQRCRVPFHRGLWALVSRTV